MRLHIVPTLYGRDGLAGLRQATRARWIAWIMGTTMALQVVQAVALLQGGWDSSFTWRSRITTLRKAPQASKGSLTLQELIIKP